MARNLRRMRYNKGMSQEELAAQAGLYRTYVGHLEREVHSPTVDTLEKLAEILDVGPNRLLHRSAAADPRPPREKAKTVVILWMSSSGAVCAPDANRLG